MIRSFGGKSARVAESAFIAENATLIGDVAIGPRSSVWFGAVLRGDVHHIRIGSETSIQDNTVIHVTDGRHPTLVGDRVTVGHAVTLHGCTVRDRCIIGMGSTVLDDATVGERVILGAGALVTPGTQIPPGTLAVGAPARVRRALSQEELEWIESSADHYIALATRYRAEWPSG